MKTEIVKNKYNFFEVLQKPTPDELEDYYAQKYYQQEKSTYQKIYSEDELKYFHNKNLQKYYELSRFLDSKENPSLLDIGCGEGFTLKFFKELGWEITGLDFSDSGLMQHNPDLTEFIITGDIYKNIQELKNDAYDVIWLDNVLEHVIDPKGLLETCRGLCKKGGIMVVEVPNDFSLLQLKAKELSFIDNDFWVALPDHLSYFNLEGLNALALDTGWYFISAMSDFPIDFNLFNSNANYVKDKSKGKGAHFQRVYLDNLMSEISIEKAVDVFKALANIGLGRQIIGFYKKN